MITKNSLSYILYVNKEDEERVIKRVQQMLEWSFIGQIVLPHIFESDFSQDNEKLSFAQGEDEESFFACALSEIKERAVMVGHPKVAYHSEELKQALFTFYGSHADFVTMMLYEDGIENSQSVYPNKSFFHGMEYGYDCSKEIELDFLWANKIVSVEFLKSIWKQQSLEKLLKDLFVKGYPVFVQEAVAHFTNRHVELEQVVYGENAKTVCREFYTRHQAKLTEELDLVEFSDMLQKHIIMKDKGPFSKLYKKMVSGFRKLKIKDQVLFYSIRKDGELTGNLQYLYPHITGKKIVCAKMNPHNLFYRTKLYYLTSVSKMIIIDDYDKYLRNVILRPGQRVVQLWHACGAFKKFGQRGTQLSIRADQASHSQYSLVTVSGDGVRDKYADAFDIDAKRVQALGVPRTDVFFDEKYREKVCQNIYELHPELKDKEVILYAPTFREVEGVRDNFEPPIDFAKLSEQLGENQMFVIAPHPVMKNKIVKGDFSNIEVIRDVATMDLMFISERLITDYSSVIFEYSLLKKPMAFFCYDLEEYDRGFYLRYPDDLPGDVVKTQEELVEFIHAKTNTASEEYEKFVEKYMGACDGHSSERIAGVLNAYREGEMSNE